MSLSSLCFQFLWFSPLLPSSIQWFPWWLHLSCLTFAAAAAAAAFLIPREIVRKRARERERGSQKWGRMIDIWGKKVGFSPRIIAEIESSESPLEKFPCLLSKDVYYLYSACKSDSKVGSSPAQHVYYTVVPIASATTPFIAIFRKITTYTTFF